MVIQWPTGYAQLPHEGGMDDQPFYTMRVFDGFKRGEKLAASKLMSSKGGDE